MPVPAPTRTSMRTKDALSLLGLPAEPSPEEIKAAYRKKALTYHPDRHLNDKDAATRKFIEIHEAYKLLLGAPDAGLLPHAAPKRRPSLRRRPATDPPQDPPVEPPASAHGAPSPSAVHSPRRPSPPRNSEKQDCLPPRSSRESPRHTAPRTAPEPGSSRPPTSAEPHHAHAPEERVRSRCKSPDTRYATLPDAHFPKPSPGAVPSGSGYSPGPRYAFLVDDLPLPEAAFAEDEPPYRPSGTRYATMPDSYFPKPSPGAVPSGSGYSPGPRYAFLPDELPAAAFADEDHAPSYSSPDTRYATFPDDEYTRRAPMRNPSRYASVPRPRQSPIPGNADMPSSRLRETSLPNTSYGTPSKSPGTRYATVPDAYYPTPSPGARYAYMSDGYSPGPRYAFLNVDEPLPNSTYAPPYKSPGTRYATVPDDEYTRPALAEHISRSESQPMPEDRGRPPRRRSPRPPSPPPPTPSTSSQNVASPPSYPAEAKRHRQKRHRARSPSTPRRHSDSSHHRTTHPPVPAPAYTPTNSGSSSHLKPYPQAELGRAHNHRSSHSPRRRERKGKLDDGHEGRNPRDSGFSEYIKISKADVPWTLDIPPTDAQPTFPTIIPPSETHGHRHSKTRSSQSRDGAFPLELSLSELYHGTTQRYRIVFSSPPPGSPPERTVNISIPPGTRPGARVRISPDVVLEVKQIQHPDFDRVGKYDLSICVELPWSGVQGDELIKGVVAFPGPGGAEVRVAVPDSLTAATQGTRVEGAGMPIPKGGKVVGFGNLYIRWEYFVPGSGQQKSKWSAIKNALRFKFDVAW